MQSIRRLGRLGRRINSAFALETNVKVKRKVSKDITIGEPKDFKHIGHLGHKSFGIGPDGSPLNKEQIPEDLQNAPDRIMHDSELDANEPDATTDVVEKARGQRSGIYPGADTASSPFLWGSSTTSSDSGYSDTQSRGSNASINSNDEVNFNDGKEIERPNARSETSSTSEKKECPPPKPPRLHLTKRNTEAAADKASQEPICAAPMQESEKLPQGKSQNAQGYSQVGAQGQTKQVDLKSDKEPAKPQASQIPQDPLALKANVSPSLQERIKAMENRGAKNDRKQTETRLTRDFCKEVLCDKSGAPSNAWREKLNEKRAENGKAGAAMLLR
jgi:hypothetical protein